MNKICFIFFVFKWDFLSVSNILLQIPLFKVYAWSNSWFRINLDKKITKIINLWTFKEYAYFFETRPNNEHHSDIIKTWTRSNRNPQSENSHRNKTAIIINTQFETHQPIPSEYTPEPKLRSAQVSGTSSRDNTSPH